MLHTNRHKGRETMDWRHGGINHSDNSGEEQDASYPRCVQIRENCLLHIHDLSKAGRVLSHRKSELSTVNLIAERRALAKIFIGLTWKLLQASAKCCIFHCLNSRRRNVVYGLIFRTLHTVKEETPSWSVKLAG